jgi:hypothetical protein
VTFVGSQDNQTELKALKHITVCNFSRRFTVNADPVFGILFSLADGCAHMSKEIAASILVIEVCRRKRVRVLQSFQT